MKNFNKYILITCFVYFGMHIKFSDALASNFTEPHKEAAARPTYTNLDDALNAATRKKKRVEQPTEVPQYDEDLDLAIAMSLQGYDDSIEPVNALKRENTIPIAPNELQDTSNVDDQKNGCSKDIFSDESLEYLDSMGLENLKSLMNDREMNPEAIYTQADLTHMTYAQQLAYVTKMSLEGEDIMGVGSQRMTNDQVAQQILSNPMSLPVVDYIKTLKLQRMTTPSDGDCAFHALGITRTEFIKAMQDNLRNKPAEIFATVRDNIRNQKLAKSDLTPQERQKWEQYLTVLDSMSSREEELKDTIKAVYSGTSTEYWATSDDIHLISLLFNKNIALLNLYEGTYVPVNIYNMGDILHLHEEPLMLMQAIDETEHRFEYIHAEGSHYTKLKRG